MSVIYGSSISTNTTKIKTCIRNNNWSINFEGKLMICALMIFLFSTCSRVRRLRLSQHPAVRNIDGLVLSNLEQQVTIFLHSWSYQNTGVFICINLMHCILFGIGISFLIFLLPGFQMHVQMFYWAIFMCAGLTNTHTHNNEKLQKTKENQWKGSGLTCKINKIFFFF